MTVNVASPAVSVVVPLYRTRSSVRELVDRVVAALHDRRPLELVLVDDCCPERSYEAVSQPPVPGVSVALYRHDRNRGQQATVITGLRLAGGDVVAVMDGDLQDAPEDLPRLLDALGSGSGADVVAAGRRGTYERRGRQATARLYRGTAHWLSGGRVPVDASAYLVATRGACERVLSLADPRVHLVAAFGRVGASIRSVPVERHVRSEGASSYAWWRRVSVAARALVVLTPAYPLVRRLAALRPPGGSVSRLPVPAADPHVRSDLP